MGSSQTNLLWVAAFKLRHLGQLKYLQVWVPKGQMDRMLRNRNSHCWFSDAWSQHSWVTVAEFRQSEWVTAHVLLPGTASASEGNSFPPLTTVINTVFIKPKLQEAVPSLVEVKGDQLSIILCLESSSRKTYFPHKGSWMGPLHSSLGFHCVPDTIFIFLFHILKHPFSWNFFFFHSW